MKRQTKLKTWQEINSSLRRDWGNVKPYTRIEEDKRRKKPKHKVRYEDEQGV